jgi:hypothetical protein
MQIFVRDMGPEFGVLSGSALVDLIKHSTEHCLTTIRRAANMSHLCKVKKS